MGRSTQKARQERGSGGEFETVLKRTGRSDKASDARDAQELHSRGAAPARPGSEGDAPEKGKATDPAPKSNNDEDPAEPESTPDADQATEAAPVAIASVSADRTGESGGDDDASVPAAARASVAVGGQEGRKESNSATPIPADSDAADQLGQASNAAIRADLDGSGDDGAGDDGQHAAPGNEKSTTAGADRGGTSTRPAFEGAASEAIEVAPVDGEPPVGRGDRTEQASPSPIRVEAEPLAPTANGSPTLAPARLAGEAHAGQAPTAPGGGAARTEDEAFASGVSRGLSAAIQQRGGSVTIRLSPESLGALRIHMTIANGEVSVRMETINDRAQQMLVQSLPALRESLESKGLTVNELRISPAPHPASIAQTNDARHGGGGDDRSEQGAQREAGDGRSRGQYSGGDESREQQGGDEPLDEHWFERRLRVTLDAVV